MIVFSRRVRQLGRSSPTLCSFFALGLLTTVLLILMAGPALADPAVPTNYRSVVNVIDPAPLGVTIEIVGGDAFLSIVAVEGNTVEVPGYFGEPYLLIDATGGVWLNTRSPARYINQDRYGTTEIPPTADAQADAEWDQVGSGGKFAWHDHRTHWMSPDLPPTIAGDRAAVVFQWSLSLTINEVETEIRGELLWFPSTNAVGPLLVGIIGMLPLLAYRRDRPMSVAIIAMAFEAMAIFVTMVQFSATPEFDRGIPTGAAIPIVGTVAAMVALWLGTSSIRSWATIGIAGTALLWWAFSTATALTAPVLPSALPAELERASVSLAMWVGIGVVAIAGFELVRQTRHTTFDRTVTQHTETG